MQRRVHELCEPGGELGLSISVTGSHSGIGIHPQGCARVMREFIDLRGGLTLALCAGAALTQIGCLLLAVSIYCAVKHEIERD